MTANLAERDRIVGGGFIPRRSVTQLGLRRGATLDDRGEGVQHISIVAPRPNSVKVSTEQLTLQFHLQKHGFVQWRFVISGTVREPKGFIEAQGRFH